MLFKKIKENVYLLRIPFGGTTTGVVLLTGKVNCLIDAGGNSEGVDGMVVPALAELGLAPCDIDCLTCTHTHADHIGGFKRMRELSVKSIAVYESSAKKLADPAFYNVEIRKAFPENSPPPSTGLAAVEVDRKLCHGDIIFDRIELISTPGHDDDAVCIYDRQTNTLISGDSIQLDGTLVQGCGAYMYLQEYRKSLEALAKISADCVLLGHPFLPCGDVVMGAENVRKLISDALLRTYEYRDFVSEMLSAGETDTKAIAVKLVEHVKGILPKYMFLPMFTVREHMKELL